MRWRTWALAALVISGLASSAACAQILGFDKGYTESDGGVPTGGATSTTGSTTSTGGTGGTGGMPPPVSCAAAADCPGQDTECVKRACTGGVCAPTYAASGTAITAQTSGNCQKIVCDGHGALAVQVDDSNVPSDSNPCTKDICNNGVPSNPPEKAGTACGGALTCDGTGHCAGCTSPADCPGLDTECQTRSCTGGLCGFLYTAAGTSVTMQTSGDCKKNVCNGMGAVSIVFDPADAPTSASQCVSAGCSMGSPVMTNVAAGAPCTMGGGKVCDGTGTCVQCLAPTSCPGTDTECQTRTCNGNTCGFANQMSGTAVSAQTPGDCKKTVCNGMGGTTSATDTGDVPTNGTVCNTASCNGSSPVLTPVASGTPCGTMKTCNGAGACTGCTTAADCPGTDTECQQRTCSMSGVCGFSYAASGTATSSQTAGDCKKNVCNGSGGISVAVDNADLPPAGQCYVGVCSNGSPSTQPAAAGAACSSGGTVCNGAGGCGACVPGDTQAFCGPKTTACCLAAKGPPSSARCDPETQSCGPATEIVPLACCCCFERDCNAAGQWDPCY